MKGRKITFWVSTVIFSALMLFSSGIYLFANDFAAQAYIALGYPTYLIYPFAVAKLLGLVAIWTRKNKVLEEWAYAGFFYVGVLGTLAHILTDGQFYAVFIALIAVIISYGTRRYR